MEQKYISLIEKLIMDWKLIFTRGYMIARKTLLALLLLYKILIYQDENMELKRLKELTGEPLYWNDYLSLPFTQKVYIFSLSLE